MQLIAIESPSSVMRAESTKELKNKFDQRFIPSVIINFDEKVRSLAIGTTGKIENLMEAFEYLYLSEVKPALDSGYTVILNGYMGGLAARLLRHTSEDMTMHHMKELSAKFADFTVFLDVSTEYLMEELVGSQESAEIPVPDSLRSVILEGSKRDQFNMRTAYWKMVSFDSGHEFAIYKNELSESAVAVAEKIESRHKSRVEKKILEQMSEGLRA